MGDVGASLNVSTDRVVVKSVAAGSVVVTASVNGFDTKEQVGVVCVGWGVCGRATVEVRVGATRGCEDGGLWCGVE